MSIGLREKDSSRRQQLHQQRATSNQPDVELGQVSILNREGVPAEVIEIGESLTVEIEYRVFRPLEKPVFGIALFRNDGVHLYGTNTAIDGIPVPALTRDGRIRVQYRNIPLLAGSYRFSIGVFQHPDRSTPLDFHDRLHGFRVISGSEEEGLVRLDHEWQLEDSIPQLRDTASR